ncbi:MAG: TonB-dependent receptor [Pseudomonadota bacterium]|nr:TonB-dependent receptor [Pseudomonadota bacterium]
MTKFGLLGTSALRSAALFCVLAAAAAPAYAQTAQDQPASGQAQNQPAPGQQQCGADDPNYDPATGDCAPSESEPARRDADGSEPEGQAITVTGTRIRLPNLESFEPTVTLDNRQIRERNFTNVADALNELPGFRGSVTPAGGQGQFGQGVNFVNNYGLGSNRTLTLVNGRRFVSSNVPALLNNASFGTQVDLNVVPAILLDRIDTVSVGGAPIYGSDAIAGTVNIILRSRFDGVEVTGLSGITEEGDNFRYNASALVGRNFFDGRANITLSASHDNVRGVLSTARDFLRLGISGALNPSAAQAARLRPSGIGPTGDGRLNPNIGFNNTNNDLAPGVVLARGITIPFLTRGGLISRTNLSGTGAAQCRNPRDPSSCFNFSIGAGVPTNNALQFDTNGNLVPFRQGILFNNISVPGGEGFRFEDFTQITSDLTRTILNGFFTFEITDNIDFFVEGTHFRSRADELVQQPRFNSNLLGGFQAALQLNVNNPFLTPQARAELTRRGVTDFELSRTFADLADLTGFNETRLNRGVAGLRGDFEIFGRNFNFEASANHGVTKVSDFGQDFNAQNFINAVNVTRNAAGQIVCTTARTRIGGNGFAAPGGTPRADPNCAPLNPFGEGTSSQAARDYIIIDLESRARLEQTVFNVNAGGSLFDIWGGPVGFNIGYENRKEEGSFTPDPALQNNVTRQAAVTPVAGEYTLNEVFGEVVLPLVSPDTGLSFLNNLQLFGRGRYVHNTVNGGFFAWAVGGNFAPIPDLEFRGNFTRSFRSPSIVELFLPVSNATTFVADLCSPGNINTGPAPAVRARNCAAFLARFPTATPLRASQASVPFQTGGNPDLENEEADTYTFGIIARPRFLPRFSASVDYVNITLNQPIASLTVAQIVSACFDNPEFNASDPANGNAFCSRIGRDAQGQVPNDPQNPAIRTGFVNGVNIKFSGIQGTMNYSLPLSALGLDGTFGMGGDLLYVRRRINNITGVAPARSDGTVGDPEFSAQLRLRYTEDNWGINTTINYVGEQLLSRFNRAPGPGSGPDAREFDEYKDYYTVSGGIFFDPTNDFRFTLSVTNLFNRRFQRYFDGFIPGSVNDQLGRRFAASARLRF